MNATLLEIDENNSTNRLVNVLSVTTDSGILEYEFIHKIYWTAYPSILILGVATLVGTLGNVLTLLAIATFRKIRNEESVFFFNLAISDLFVTTVADPMSILGKCSF